MQEWVASESCSELGWKGPTTGCSQGSADVWRRTQSRCGRVRERDGEGHRMNDLKRWHMGFTRSAGQDPDLVQPGENYASCSREADDPFFLWPIPTDEVQANPQIEQNPAYTNN